MELLTVVLVGFSGRLEKYAILDNIDIATSLQNANCLEIALVDS